MSKLSVYGYDAWKQIEMLVLWIDNELKIGYKFKKI